MLTALLVKMVATAVVVILVAETVGHLGPRLGGIVAGMPIVLGPAYFFMVQEQSAAFVADAAVSTLHGLTATLVLTVCYVLGAARLGAVASLGVAALCWVPAASMFAMLPGGTPLALLAYVLVFFAVRVVDRRLQLPQPRVSAPSSWPDLLMRGILAGVVVALATTLVTAYGSLASGLLIGFPVGLLAIGLTLHQRYGAAVSRATMAAVQPALFSLVAFAATVALAAERTSPMLTFTLALLASLGVSIALLAVSHLRTHVAVA